MTIAYENLHNALQQTRSHNHTRSISKQADKNYYYMGELMTNKTKVQILKRMRKVILQNKASGLCKALSQALTQKQADTYYWNDEDVFYMTDILDNHFKITKPIGATGFYWFELNADGQKKRLAIIDKAIKRYTK